LDAAAISSIKRSAKKGTSARLIAARLFKNRGQMVSGAGKHSFDQRGRTLSAANKQQRIRFCVINARAQTRTWLYIDSKFFYIFKNEAGLLRGG